MANLKKRIFKKISVLKKSAFQNFLVRDNGSKNILFIIGCQRSGTTLMTQIFDKDLLVKAYGEFSELSDLGENKIRLNPLSQVKSEIEKNKVSSIVLKPLVESQNTNNLLNFFENSHCLWMFRHYQDVSSSNLKYFGLQNGINNLRSIINRETGNWRSDNISENTFDLVQKYFSEKMLPHDAAALFWIVRNRLFFELELDKNQRVAMCKYEDLVNMPLKTMENIYTFSGFQFPGKQIVAGVHAKSVNKGKGISLSAPIQDLCEEMLARLSSAYFKQIITPPVSKGA